MINLIKIGFILIVIVSASFSEDSRKSLFNTKLPRIELELNTGLAWFMQGKVNINLNDNIYSKIRLSGSFLASEYGFTAGYQRSHNNKDRMQLGIGYSNGKIEPFVPGGPNPDDTTEHWEGVMIEGNFIHYFKNEIIGCNIGFNFIISSNKSLPSVNLGFVVGL
jgi:hypothetical protein